MYLIQNIEEIGPDEKEKRKQEYKQKKLNSF